MATLSKRLQRVVKPDEYKKFAETHPESHNLISAGITKGMLFGAGLEAACVTGFVKTKNPLARAVFGVGAGIGMIFCAAGGYVMGCELEASDHLEDITPEDATDENVEDELVDVEEGDPENPTDDDGIIIE